MTAQCEGRSTSVDGEPLPVTSELADRLLVRVAELSERLYDRLMAMDDRYATTELISPEELRRSCRHNMVCSLRSLAGQVPEGVDLFEAARTTARRRADAGFPLEALLHAYRLGTEVLWAALLEEARDRAPDLLGDMLDSAVHVMQLMDVMSMAAADEYRLRMMQLRRRDTERRQAVLDSLLEGRGNDPDVAAEAARVLDLPVDPTLAVVVVEHERPSDSPAFSPREALESFGFHSVWRLRSDREVGLVLLGNASLPRLVACLGAVVEGRAAVSSVVEGLGEVAAALRMAELALLSSPEDAARVVAFDDQLPEALLAASPLVSQRLRECALGGLLELEEEKRRILLDTLQCWFRTNRSASETSEQLHCHRNTVLHRLNRIEDLSGRRLADSRDELILRLALLPS